MVEISFTNIIKFNGSKKFGLWLKRVKDLLMQQDLVRVLSGKKVEGMSVTNWKEPKAKIVSTIRHCLANEVMYHITDEESLTTIY